MDKNKKMGIFLSALRIIETVYLIISLFIVYVRRIDTPTIQTFVAVWVTTSFMILPVLLFKNVLVAILNNGALTANQKIWILVRCALYVVLTFVAYPLVSHN